MHVIEIDTKQYFELILYEIRQKFDSPLALKWQLFTAKNGFWKLSTCLIHKCDKYIYILLHLNRCNLNFQWVGAHCGPFVTVHIQYNTWDGLVSKLYKNYTIVAWFTKLFKQKITPLQRDLPNFSNRNFEKVLM